MDSGDEGDLKLAAIAVACLSAIAALASVPVREPVRLVATWLFILTGPVSGWIVAVSTHALPSALPFLLPVTALCAVPLATYARWRGPDSLAVAVFAWASSGWVYTVAISI